MEVWGMSGLPKFKQQKQEGMPFSIVEVLAMKRAIAGLLLAGTLSMCFCAVPHSFANYNYDELVKSIACK